MNDGNVQDENRDVICPECNEKVTWTDWRAVMPGSDAETRRGRCRCPTKTYLQGRHRTTAKIGKRD
jgi:hypothetical protein